MCFCVEKQCFVSQRFTRETNNRYESASTFHTLPSKQANWSKISDLSFRSCQVLYDEREKTFTKQRTLSKYSECWERFYFSTAYRWMIIMCFGAFSWKCHISGHFSNILKYARKSFVNCASINEFFHDDTKRGSLLRSSDAYKYLLWVYLVGNG